jgi:hypothetical protein
MTVKWKQVGISAVSFIVAGLVFWGIQSVIENTLGASLLGVIAFFCSEVLAQIVWRSIFDGDIRK